MHKKLTKKFVGIFMAIVIAITGFSYSPIEEEKVKATEKGIPEGYTPIYTIDELYGIRNNLQGKYILMNDIDLSEETAEGGSLDTGNGWSPIDNFSGTFDGNGYRIKGMTIYGNPTGAIGFFGNLGLEPTIKNVGLVDVNISVAGNGKCCGALVGGYQYTSLNTIENCFVTGQIECGSNYEEVGGIAGALGNATVYNCYNVADITTIGDDNEVGGIVGGECGIISKCYNLGKIDGGKGNAICSSWGGFYNCFYLKGTGKETEGSTPLTDAQMKKASYFTNFDFRDVWEVDANSSYQYPQLKNCMQVRIRDLAWKQQPLKTEYYQGDKLDLNGGKVLVTYENRAQGSCDITGDMVSNYNMMEVGEQEVIVRKGNMTVQYKITVKPILVSKVTLDKTSLSLEPGSTATLSATVSPSNATYPDIEWSSSNDDVVTVDQKGKVRAIKFGTAQVTAKTSNGIKGICQVVVEIPCEDIYIDYDGGTAQNGSDGYSYFVIDVGSEFCPSYEIYPTNTSDVITWTSEDSSIARVDQQGKVTALKPGITQITATARSGVTDYYRIVVPKDISSVEIDGIEDKVYKEDQSEYTQNIIVSDGGKILRRDEDYYVEYENNDRQGIATIRIVGKFLYAGTIIRQFRIASEKTEAETKNGINKSEEDTSYASKKIILPKISITSIKTAKKKLTIRWKRVSLAKGYQIQVAKNRKFTKGKKSYNVSSYTSKKVYKGARKKTYYIRVRAYAFDSHGNRIYGKFSSVKKKSTK